MQRYQPGSLYPNAGILLPRHTGDGYGVQWNFLELLFRMGIASYAVGNQADWDSATEMLGILIDLPLAHGDDCRSAMPC
jgi:hypothetical protein